MQKLEFETAWDKTIAPEDRSTIEKLFQKTKGKQTDEVTILPIRQAFNHRNDLLVIVLLHNFTDDILSFESINVVYMENDITIAQQEFSFPHVTLKPKTSMPWTFIFPETTRTQEATLENGRLIFQ